MLKIAICDDDPIHLKHTAFLVQQELASYQTDMELFREANELQTAIRQEGYLPDLAILDIEIGEENGIDLAKELNHEVPACRIIFLTGHAGYASASYEARHVWFVLKSEAERYLGQALQRALESGDAEPDRVGIHARSGGKAFFIPLGDVLYIDREGRKTRIVCREATYPVSGTPYDLITNAVAPFFMRCHQGFWVNLRQIQGLDKNEFVLTDGVRIPISRSYRDEARQKFFRRFWEE